MKMLKWVWSVVCFAAWVVYELTTLAAPKPMDEADGVNVRGQGR